MTHPSAPGEDFGVTVRNLDGVDHVVVRGELDISSTSMLREAMLDPAVCAQAVLLVDLVQTHFIDSSGVASLVVAHRTTVARGARLVIACQDGLTLQVLDMVGLARVLEIVPDAREFLAAHSQVCGPSEPGTMRIVGSSHLNG